VLTRAARPGLGAVLRRWRGAASIGLGLPLLLGSSPAAAAGSGAALLGGLSTWIGLTAAAWAMLAPQRRVAGFGTAALAGVGALMVASAFWAWRHQRTRQDASRRGSGLLPRTRPQAPIRPPDLPAGFDDAEVLDAARSRFLRLQAAWDAGDVSALRHLTTPDMLEELLSVLMARGTTPNRTDVITLHAELVGLEEVNAAYLASVEFSGLIRESAGEGAVPFRELWMLASAKDGAAPTWRLARQQALF
jgi:predicted lipid-binding transport protein (Tim44 family)